MKIERTKLKKSNSELPEACKLLRDSLAAAKDDQSMYEILKNISTWEYGKSELYHWVDVLDMFDDIMERCCQTVDGNKWMLACDQPENAELKRLMLQVMKFTSMLIEYSFQRHSYESMDHLITLMSSSDMDVVLEVLNVLYVFSKRSNFMGRLSAPRKQEIVIRLLYLAESWGGKENGFGLAECCQDLAVESYPSSATTVHFEFYTNRASKTQPSSLCTIHLEKVDKSATSPSDVMTKVMSEHEIPDNKQMLLFTHIRLAHSFSNYKLRTNCILARLQAISILVYSHAVDNEVAHQIIYSGFINELVNVLELTFDHLIDMKAAVMRTLTAIIHLERNPKLEAIIDITGANTYHGFLPSLVRKCIQYMVEPASSSAAGSGKISTASAAGSSSGRPSVIAFPHSFSTALFSFLYHLASYESGGEALLSCGIMPSLLKLANWYSDEQEHITFVTRAVRIIDLMTNMCTQSFENHNGLKVFIDRLDHEVTICRKEQPFIIRPKRITSMESIDAVPMDVSDSLHNDASQVSELERLAESSSDLPSSNTQSDDPGGGGGGGTSGGHDPESATPGQQTSDVAVSSNIEVHTSEQSQRDNLELMDSQPSTSKEVVVAVAIPGLQCLPQRSALLKSILNFFKKVIPEPALSFADSIRHIMEGTMPKALQHVISNAEYYGASLFLLALDVVTVFVFQEPSLLSSLQDKGLTEVVLNSLLVKDVPTTREVLAALPNVFSALCLNQRGLDAFVEYKPFDKLFKVLLSPEYLPAMRKRKSSDAFGDTANNLGTAMDELMRHQPSLRVAAIKAIIGLLNEIIRLGTDTQYTCTSKNSDSGAGGASATDAGGNIVSGGATQNSDIDESEDDDEVTEGATDAPAATATPATETPVTPVTTTTATENVTTDDVEMSSDQTAKPATPKAVPLMDYIHNVMKFVDAIMGNSTADDHCMEFITQGGLEPLFQILRLPNLPVDFPTSPACQSVSSVCTILLKLCHEPKVLSEGLKQLSEALACIEKLYEPLPPPGGSALLSELVSAVGESGTIPEAVSNPKSTPLLHNLSAVQAYVKVFVHMCRFGQADLKQISLVQWGTEKGLSVLAELGKLYYSLVWEGTVLLALCSDNDLLPGDSEFGRTDLAKLLPKCSASSSKDMDTDSNSSVGVTAAMEGLSTADLAASALTTPDEETSTTAETPGGAGESSTVTQAATGGKKTGPVPNNQMKQIRPLLNVSSRLGGTLAELFQNVLVKLCVGSVMLRQRRTHQPPPAPSVPSANARAISKALCKLSTNGLNWKPPTEADVPKLHMYFLMSVVGFAKPMLFEENKHSYHLMLQEFENSGGLEAYFTVFYNVVNQLPPSESFRGGPNTTPTKIPDYLVEFLDTWLLLAEKMVHPKSVLDSVYPLPAKGNTSDYKPFNPTQYLKNILKPVFNAVLKLWNHRALTNTKDADAELTVQLEQVAVSMLTILCHVIQAEKVIKEREAKEAKTKPVPIAGTSGGGSASGAGTSGGAAGRSGAASSSRSSIAPGLADLSDDNVLLRDLMDMGFSRERCVEALNFTSTVEAATDYLVTHMLTPAASTGPQQSGGSMELSEDEQIRAAIELSLTAASPDATEAKKKKVETKAATDKPAAAESRPTMSHIRDDDNLTSADLDDLTETLVSGCMNMLDAMPNTVFKICQLMVTVSNRNGNQWRENMFKQLFLEMTDVNTQLTEDASRQAWGSSKDQAVEYFTKSERNLKLASRMHLLTLLIQEVETPCISVLQDNGFINSVLCLVSQCMPGFKLAGTAGTPLWLAPIMLIVDQCEKAAIASKRKAEAKHILGASNAWKWFDDRNGRWCAYNSTSNNTIDTAYKNGESSVRFTAGRRKYLVKFNAMIQLNEETGNRRPVMLTIPTKSDRDKRGDSQMDIDSSEMSGLLPDQVQTLLRLCVDLISVPVECETLHAVLRLCLRCTREHEMADLFVSSGGVERLLQLSQASAFTGFTSLCTLIIRHVLEDEHTLTLSLSQVLKEVAAGVGSNLCGVSSSSMGSKEVNYVMRQLGPAICRNPHLLKTIAQKQLKISLQNGKEPPWSTQHQVDLISWEDKSISLTQPPSETFRNIITSLLNRLITPYTKENDAETKAVTDKSNQLLHKLLTESGKDSTPVSDKPDTKSKTGSANTDVTSTKPADTSTKPLLSKSAVLRMLSEFVKSYPSCANIVVQHSYLAGQSDSVNETSTALSFVFDRLLPSYQTDGDKDCPALSRVLLASIASCNHSPEAQTSLVNELKSALQRTLSMAEVMNKYTHIQTLTGLVSTLVEACPSTQSQNNKSPFPLKQMNPNAMNQMVKLMVKRGLVSDIAKIPHSLDLSNPATVNTINALLKPLETLSRIVNQPQLGPTPAMGNRPALTRNDAVSALNEPAQQNGEQPAGQEATAQSTPGETAANTENETTNTQQQNGTTPPATAAENNAADTPDEAEFDQEDEDNDITAQNDNDINFIRSAIGELNAIERQTEALSRMLSAERGGGPVENGSNHSLPDDDDEERDEERERQQRLYNVHQQVNEVLEQALDEILSQGHSDEDNEVEMGPGAAAATMSDSEAEEAEAIEREEMDREEREEDDDEPPPYHEDEEDDTTDEDEDDEGHDDDDDDEGDNHNNADNRDGGELGMDFDDGWSDDDDIGGEGGNLLSNLFGLDDDDDLFSRLEAYDQMPFEGAGRPRILVAEPGAEGFRTLHVPFGHGANDMDNALDEQSVNTLPPAPNAVPVTHPLMNPSAASNDVSRGNNRFVPGLSRMRRNAGGAGAAARADRLGDRLGQGLQLMANAPTSSNFLQRLFGAGMAANILQLTTRIGGGNSGAARFYISDEDPFRSNLRNDDEPYSDFLQDGMDLMKTGGGPGVLSSLPSTLYRWTEECRVLDGSSVHDIITAIKPEIIDKLQAVKKEQIEATQKKEKEAKEKKAADEKKTTNTGVTTSNSTPIPNTLTSVDTSGGQVATETERLQSELRNLTRNARALASNVEDLQEQLNMDALGTPNTELLNSMGALFGEDIAQDVARLYGRRSRQEHRTLMSVPQPQPHTGSSEETPRPISTTANNSDIVSSLRAAISSAQRTLTSDTTTTNSSQPAMAANLQTAQASQPSDASASSQVAQSGSSSALPELETNSTAVGLNESSANHLPLPLLPTNQQQSSNETLMDHSPMQESAANSLLESSNLLSTPTSSTNRESVSSSANQQSALESTPNQASIQESTVDRILSLPSSASETPVSGIQQETDQDRPCTPPSLFSGRADPVPPPQPETQPDAPVPLATLSSLSDENLMTAGTSTEPAVELVNASLAETTASNNNGRDNSELVEDTAAGVESVEADATPPTLFPTQPATAQPLANQQIGQAAAAVSDPSSGPSSGGTAAAQSEAASSSGLPAGLEGVDPSFLEALPESIRREVIAEQLRLARVQNQVRESTAATAAPATTTTTTQGETPSTNTPPTASTGGATGAQASNTTSAAAAAAPVGDVSAEFLAALPPAIQEEVLAVQRAEQARQAAVSAGPDNSQDPGSFLNSLPPSLRQQVLADMDDSQISVLPADLMAEAQLLRGELEDRNRRLQDQLFTGGSTLGNILRQSGMSGWGGGGVGRLSTSRFIRRGVGGGGLGGPWGSNSSSMRGVMKPVRRGRQLLDQEALTCLLVMLFLDEPRLNVSRLHRILKNLGYHCDTLLWIIRALISILIKTNESKDKPTADASQAGGKQISQSAWLSFGMDAALGCRANVFQVQHNTSSKRNVAGTSGNGGSVTIHPQAAQLVCQHVMDTLIYLSKAFTQQFLPNPATVGDNSNSATKDKTSKDGSVRAKSPKQSNPTSASAAAHQSFWDVLVKLDQMRLNKKGKGSQRLSTVVPSSSSSASPGLSDDLLSDKSIEESPMGQLMALLSSPVIRRSPALTDRLLKLLSNISTAITSESSSKPPSGAGGSSSRNNPDPFASLLGGTNPPSAVSGSQPTVVKSIVKHDNVFLPNQLKLAVEVLTSKSCSEEGLEDSTKLLIRLSNANNATKQNIVKLLLCGAQQIGHTVCDHIESLLKEAQEHNRQLAMTGTGEDSTPDLQTLDSSSAAASSEPRPSTSGISAVNTAASVARGLIANRFQQGAVITVAPQKNKRSHDLQLPSMSLLTAKSSSQQFLLRLLKVVIQLSDKKPAASSTGAASAPVTETASATVAATDNDQAGALVTAETGDNVTTANTNNAEASSTAEPVAETTQSDQTTNVAATLAASASDQRMDVDTQEPGPSTAPTDEKTSKETTQHPLCERLELASLWTTLGQCLSELSRNSDQNAVLILQPAVEAFFLVHAGQREHSSAKSRRDRHRREDQLSHLNLDEPPASPASNTDTSLAASKQEADVSPEIKKFLKFAETHRTVLNQILRQTQTPLSDGPFSVLVDHMKLLDFDVKNRYFRAELQKLDEGLRPREDLAVHVRRDHVFEDSYRELFRRTPDEWKHRLYIVFEGEEGQDAGGLLREWYLIMSREIFNPNYALFMTTPQDRVTYTINQLSYYNNEHLSYFRFVGRIIAKAIYDNKLLECYFTRSFYKHITGQPVRYTDMEAEDYSFHQGLEFLLNHDVNDLGYELAFSTEIQELGVTQTRELKPNGSNILVTEENKKDYVKLVCQEKMTGAIRKQLNAFLEGFYDIIPRYLISIFNEQELELLISGLPTVDVDDLKGNSEYHKYNTNSLQIIWFWRALRSFDQAERARFLQFVTGTSKVPLQGFAFLEGMNGTQKFQIHRDDRSTDRLPCAHTCFNQLDLPAYETYDKLKKMLLLVINECSEGFGLA